MKTAVIVLAACLAAIILLSPVARADVIMPTLTKVYFDNGGAPYDAPVSFTVTCYGYSYPPGPGVDKPAGSYAPEDVFGFSADCPRYGCEIGENYYLNYRHIDWCDLNGTAGGKSFYIHDYSDSPVSGCDYGNGERSCTLRFSIPAGTVPAVSASATPLPTAGPSVSPAPVPSPAPQPNLLSSLVRGLVCFLVGLFGGAC